MALTLCIFSLSVSQASAQNTNGRDAKQQSKLLEQYARLSPADFAAKVKIDDDELEVAATLTTEPGFRFKGGFTDRMRADSFLRAIINKRTGTATFQLYAVLLYSGEYRQFTDANYQAGDSPASTPLTISSHRVDCQYGCVNTDDIAFEVPETVLRGLAKRADERPVRPWRFRLKARTGEDWSDDMAPAEAAGLLAAVDGYRQKHQLP
ncbi:hypothetical protein PIB19_00775 [Sphingomonas sp. 7/4-4]|uniref:hypothetical protein n=1 Tax=Sphingomonas sp. 7/4-4 TaxID=3018446 RepID=UPI0022F3CE36|nr:hypothetical protein [Sphingomonas sp. 7/4-4]WBY08124.1 hypothetical protein PIB19_00775 [Sphingomonas sp. 7/4-4]